MANSASSPVDIRPTPALNPSQMTPLYKLFELLYLLPSGNLAYFEYAYFQPTGVSVFDNCPCCSGMQYNLCCQPYLSGDAIPGSPEALMRSRYTAWALHDIDYLIATWHPACRSDKLRQALTDTIQDPQWIGLNITNCEPGSDNNEGFVTFFARYIEKQQTGAIHERSRFLREDHRWYYIDGATPRISRNDPCPCGSQKKYKKCCGQ